MKRSYIILSLIVSQALCADSVIADFSGTNGTTPEEGKLKPASVTKPNGGTPPSTEAKPNEDWTGSITSLKVKTDNLTFEFTSNNGEKNLIFTNGLTFTNQLEQSNPNTPTTANITIKKENGQLTDLTIGSTSSTSTYDYVTIGSNINLKITDFTNVNIQNILSIASGSTFDVSSSGTNFTNNGGIILQGDKSTLKVNNSLKNNGTILMREGSSIESVSSLDIDTTSPNAPTKGTITVQGKASINSGGNDLEIKNQDITLQNLASRNPDDKDKTTFTQAELTLKTTNTSNGTLTLGDTTNGTVNIIGELSKTDDSITNLEGTSNVGNLVLEDFTTINAKNVNFKNVNVTSENATSMSLDSGKLGLENTSITLASSSTISATTASTITLTEQNTISVGESGLLTIKGEHNFVGNGSLDFVGQTINLGNGSSATLKASGSGDSPTIGVSAKTINTNSFTLTGLTLQTIGGSSIVNTSMTLSGSTIESIENDGSLANLKILNSGTIDIANSTSATLRGQNISITGQTINLKKDTTDKLTSLTLQAESGGVTLDAVTVSGENTTLANNILNLNTLLLTLKGKVELKNVAMTSDRDITIIGTETDSTKGLFISKDTNDKVATLAIGEGVDGGARFHALTLSSQGLGEKEQANVSIESNNGTVDFRASSFTFQDQNISLANNASGTELRLFAYGNGVIKEEFYKMSNGSSNAQLSGSGAFIFSNTTFADGSGSKVELYAGSDGVSVLPTNLTLSNVSIDAKIIDNNGGNSYNSLNLSASNGSINILGDSTIHANNFIYNYMDNGSSINAQGIGVDLNIGNETQVGKLTLQSDTSSENFVVGGNITLDIRANQSGNNVEIELKNGSSNKLSDNSLGLTFRGGGLTVIGSDAGSSSHTFKAKSFTFTEVKGADDVVIDSPFVKVKNAQLTLNGDSNMNTIDFVGKVYFEGATTGSNGVSKLLVTNNGKPSGTDVTLTLHDIDAVGNSAIDSNKLTFSDSNITVSNSGDSGLTLKDINTSLTPTDTLAGTINSITLNSGKLAFQYNTSSDASITFNADSVITSSGTSSLTLKTIKVGDGSDTNLYSLNVTDGTFTLQEATAGNQLGAITLGSESSLGGSGGNFVYYKENSSQPAPPPNPTYNDLKLKGDITSYGDSSIKANTFEIQANGDKNYTISSSGGELKLIAQDTASTPALTATADISLNNGSLGYYGKDNTLASLSLGSTSSISSVGDSTLQAKSLDLNGASISASGGTLTLKGISTSTTAGNVVVGNAGVLTLQNSNTSLATLRIKEGSTLGLSADVAYVTPDSPLGGGKFGQVKVQSLLFESRSGSLINIALNTSSTSSYADSLFALREGAITLITTQDGIKKKESSASYTDITLEDITTDTSGLTSITLTPYLQSGTDKSGNSIIKDLLLDLRVSQTNVAQLIESIKDPNAKESMSSIVNSGNNALILESIMQGNGNALKVGMAEYIAQGNVAVVGTALDYINGAIYSLEDSMLASNKIYELIAMLRTANVENRMVRGKNPFMAKTQLSHLIKAYSGVAYASSDDELLLEEEYTGPNYGEIWASFDGAMSFSQEESGNSSLYGFSAGYDTLLGEKKNYLLGFYASYGYGANSVNYARNNSHNFGLGFYTRMSFESSEVDLILSQNIGLNHTDVDLGASGSRVAQMLKQTLAYNFYTTDIEARYGYVFKVGSEESPYYFRPFGGINFALIVNSGARGDGEAELGIKAMNTYQLSVSVGVEMRKYFGEENYLYLLPILQKGLLNDGGGTKIGFYGTENIAFTPTYNVDTTMAVYLGGQGNIGENLAVNGGVGVKLGFEKKDLLTNWNVGLRYKF